MIAEKTLPAARACLEPDYLRPELYLLSYLVASRKLHGYGHGVKPTTARSPSAYRDRPLKSCRIRPMIMVSPTRRCTITAGERLTESFTTA